MKAKLIFHITLALALAEAVSGAGSIGDAAPALTVEHWIKGPPVKVGPGGNIFVVEFWATWCGPCKRTIPHLTEVQKRFANRGVVVIGVSDEKLVTVQPFVAAQGESMAYRVAVDSSKRSFQNWHTAFGDSGIPHAFVVNTNGMIMWHGFPNEELDRTLEKLLAGTFDLERAKNREAGDRLVVQYTAQVSKPNGAAQAAPLGERILADYSQDWRIPNHLAKAIITEPATKSRDFPLALRATTKATEMTRRRSSDALEMHARAQFANGSKPEAIQTLKDALLVCKDSGDRSDLEKLLSLFEKNAAKTAGK